MSTIADAQAQADEERLAQIRAELPPHVDTATALYAERLDIWRRLSEAGVSNTRLAELSGTDSSNVRVALHKARRQTESTPG